MRRYMLRRLALFLPVLLGVVTLVFFLIHLIPGDPVDLMLGESANPADRAALRSALKLDQPILVQYKDFLYGLAQGDWGRSIPNGQPVFNMIAERYPATLQLTLASMLLAFSMALPLGILSATYPRTPTDYGALFFALIGLSLPSFWMGPLFILLFSLKLGWFPVSGSGGLSHLVLPALTLGLGMAALLTRMIRASLLEVVHKEFVTAAYAKGLSRNRVMLRHALPNALTPLLSTCEIIT